MAESTERYTSRTPPLNERKEVEMRKIDEIVAVKVFNAARCTNANEANAIPKDTPFVTAWWVDSKGEEKAFWWRHSNVHNGAILQPFKPSESIEAAWEVVRHLKSKGERLHFDDFDNRYSASFSNGVHHWKRNYEHASETMAICGAALKAIGMSHDEITAAMEAK